MCPTDLKKELTAQHHLFPDYAQMKAHVVTVINSRTHGPAQVMLGNLNEEGSNYGASGDGFEESEDEELYRLEIRNGKKVFTKQTDRDCLRCGCIGHIRANCRAKTHVDGELPKSAPRGKGVGSCEE